MSLSVTKMTAGTCKQKLTFVPNAPNTCFIPAPPPPAGPKGIPTPFPITCDTGTIDDGITGDDLLTVDHLEPCG